MTWLFFLLSLASAALTYNVRRPISRPQLPRVFGFFGGWVWGEAAPWVIALHLALVIGFGIAGAVSGFLGFLGLLLMAGSCAVLANTFLDSSRAAVILDRALRDGLGDRFEERIRTEARSKFESGVRWDQFVLPFRTKHADVECIRGIQFGRERGTDLKLDVHRHRSAPQNAPVLLQLHGGGWVIGYKENQAQPLITRLASKGWVCVNADYRLSPHATFPEHLIDCKRAVAWIRENIGRYGGDPNFIVVTGGSAGGHLSSMVGLTGNAPGYQPGFEKVDTRVQACVPFYGIYDMTNRHGFHDPTGIAEFLEEHVMKGSYDEIPDVYHASSPLDRVHADAPPFFILHGDCDTLAPVDDARIFSEQLRSKSKQPVLYAELPGAQHAFDIFHCPRSQAAIDSVERFAEYVYTEYLEQASSTKRTPKKRSATATKGAAKAKPTASRPTAKRRTAKGAETAGKSTSAKAKKPAQRAKTAKAAKAKKPAEKEGLNGAAETGSGSRVVHLPASKSEAGKTAPRRSTSAKAAARKRKPAAKTAATSRPKRKPKDS